jgi:putative endonuclease
VIVRLSTGDPAVHMSIKQGFPPTGRRATLTAMTMARQAVGAYGERCAVQHLVATGLRVVARNWRCAHGEVDIIAWDGDALVFCEVKTRRGARFGSPGEAVVPAKARRLRRLAGQWLEDTGIHADEVRFDVVSVLVPRRGAAQVEHIRAAF